MIRRQLLFPVIVFSILSLFGNVKAAMYGGVDFPAGLSSFADEVTLYSPVIISGQPTLPYRESKKALGAPDFDGDANGIDHVSLGKGGSIVLRFTDNALTGSGSNADDLWIFEIGPDVEDTFVAISKDNITWKQVGKVTGGSLGIDIDLYGFGTSDYFSYVRLTDDPDEGNMSGSSVGADIDSIGAISSAAPVPIPGAFWLLGSGLIGLVGLKRKLQR